MKKKDTFNFEYYNSYRRLYESMYLVDTQVQQNIEIDSDDVLERDNTLSLIKRLGDLEKEQQETRIIQSKYAISATRSSSIRVWKGSILSIDSDSFCARLEDESGFYKPRLVSIKKTVINRLDWDDFFHYTLIAEKRLS